MSATTGINPVVNARRPLRLLALAGLVPALALSCPTAAGAAPRLSKVGDFVEPTELKAPPGDRRRLFVLEKDGVVRLVRDGLVRSQAFLDVSARVENSGERGMLSIAFAPDYSTSRRFYLFYTANGGDLQLDEFRRSASSAELADDTTRRSVLTIEHSSAGNHNGGQLHFGPDGLLYLSTGDGGTGGDAARDTASLLGKLLRIDPRQAGSAAFRVPSGNPFGNAVYSYGLRNPFRWSFDRQTGDLTIGDVGQNAWEEVSFRPRGQGAGADFGWNQCEGNHDYPSTSDPCTHAGSVRPVIEYANPGGAAVTGGVVVRDSSLPTLFGRYLYADFFAPDIRSARLSASGASDDRSTGLQSEQIAAFSEDAGGCVYVVSLTGPVYRIADRSPRCPAPGSSTGGSDDDPPVARLSGRRLQKFSKKGVLVSLKCNEACSITALGTFSTPSGTSKVWKLKRVKRKLAAGKRLKLRLKMPSKGSRAARRALRKGGRRLRVQVRVRARDTAGNLKTSKLKLKLKR